MSAVTAPDETNLHGCDGSDISNHSIFNSIDLSVQDNQNEEDEELDKTHDDIKSLTTNQLCDAVESSADTVENCGPLVVSLADKSLLQPQISPPNNNSHHENCTDDHINRHIAYNSLDAEMFSYDQDKKTENNAFNFGENNYEEFKFRKVKFPKDGNLVSGYLDPPNPWSQFSICSTEQLVCEYKASCDQNGIKPFTHVLDQLKGIDLSICNDRYDMLSLRNLKVDHRHIESLESILKRVQFKTLDFENVGLEDDSAIALFDMIEYYESCCKLNIGNNSKVGIRGWQTCSRMLKKTPCLIVLDIHSVALSEQSIPALVRSLRIASHLVTLHLEQCNITGRNLLILITALRTNDSLRELLLADNKMVPTDGQHLCSLLKSTTTLQLLDLRNNGLQDFGCCQVCEGLFEQSGDKGLASLILWHNQITDAGMTSLAIALGAHRHLQTLNLGHNPISSDGIHQLKDGLLRNRSLLRVGLQGCRITCEGAVALAEFLAETQRLIRLDLRDNQIKTAGLMALKLALNVNKSLTRMDLDRDAKKEPSVKDYAEQQQMLLGMIYELLLRNKTISRDLEMKQLDEQQLLMEREETSSQDSLHRPVMLELPNTIPLDLTTSSSATETAPDLLPPGRFTSITSPSDRVLNDFSEWKTADEPLTESDDIADITLTSLEPSADVSDSTVCNESPPSS